MFIRFETEDLVMVKKSLKEAELPTDDATALKVLEQVSAAFQQQRQEEVDYMVGIMSEEADRKEHENA
jgi:ATP adenylyltransferase/5',5'''-P-1,P-4-tetraphosphate phosphorylase II